MSKIHLGYLRDPIPLKRGIIAGLPLPTLGVKVIFVRIILLTNLLWILFLRLDPSFAEISDMEKIKDEGKAKASSKETLRTTPVMTRSK